MTNTSPATDPRFWDLDLLARLWAEGLNTCEIAVWLGGDKRHEPLIAHRTAAIRKRVAELKGAP